MEDIFAIQDEIAATIVQTLTARLSGGVPAAQPAKKLVRRYTDNVEAYNLYLQGRHFWSRRYVGLMWKGIECFNKAIELDPSYTLAYTGLVESYYVLGVYGILPPSEARAAAKTSADKALELDDQLAEAHYALGIVKYFFEWDSPAARAALKRALSLNPSYGICHSWFGVVSVIFSESEAIEHARRGVELEPYSGLCAAAGGFTCWLLRKHDLALEFSNKALELEPDHLLGRWVRGLVCLHSSAVDQGLSDIEKALAMIGRRAFFLGLLGYGYALAGRAADARNILAEMEGSRSTQYVPPVSLAWVYLGLGETDAALDQLDQALENRDPMLALMQASPFYDSVRNHPRLERIVRTWTNSE